MTQCFITFVESEDLAIYLKSLTTWIFCSDEKAPDGQLQLPAAAKRRYPYLLLILLESMAPRIHGGSKSFQKHCLLQYLMIMKKIEIEELPQIT